MWVWWCLLCSLRPFLDLKVLSQRLQGMTTHSRWFASMWFLMSLPWPSFPHTLQISANWCPLALGFWLFSIIALCGYPLVKMELEIQTRFLPRLPFSCNSIISDKIWRKMSLSLSIFLVLPQISLVKYYETIKILMQIFWYFRSHFHNVAGPGEKSYFGLFFWA